MRLRGVKEPESGSSLHPSSFIIRIHFILFFIRLQVKTTLGVTPGTKYFIVWVRHVDDIRKRNRPLEDKWVCKAGVILIYLNTITPITLRGHNLPIEKAKKPERKEIPQSKKPKATFALNNIYHGLK